MPFPKTAFAIRGGCNCKAIRYIVDVPEFASRPQNPYRNLHAKLDEDLRVPMVAVDHCNDCRRATGAILPTGLATDIATISTTCATRGDPERYIDLTADELFDLETISQQDVFLTFYKSSEKRTRWFCGRCGTSLAYTVDSRVILSDRGWPKMLDLWLGTVDREDLDDGDKIEPERQLWCDMGVGWIRRFARNGMPEHPLTKIDQVIHQSRGIDEIVEEARSHLKRVTPHEAWAEIERSCGPPLVLVDIRPAAQRAAMGEIEGALVIERNVLEWRFDQGAMHEFQRPALL